MRFCLCLLTLALLGCASLSPRALLEVSKLDPLTTDPGLIAARLDLPSGIEVPQGKATLTLSATRADTGDRTDGLYPLVNTGEVWQLSEADAERLRAQQTLIRTWKAEAGEAVKGSLSINLEACFTAEGPDPSAKVAVDLSLDGGTSFFPFLRNLTVDDVTGALAEDAPTRRCT